MNAPRVWNDLILSRWAIAFAVVHQVSRQRYLFGCAIVAQLLLGACTVQAGTDTSFQQGGLLTTSREQRLDHRSEKALSLDEGLNETSGLRGEGVGCADNNPD